MNPNPNPFSLFTLLTVLLLAPIAALHAAEPVTAQARWENSELIYEQPAASPDAGQPIGNGRMGTMVWTSPEVIHLQINRVDVFAVNRDHPGSQFSATDYCGGIAGVVVHVGGPTQIINSPVVRIVTTSGSRYCIHPAA